MAYHICVTNMITIVGLQIHISLRPLFILTLYQICESLLAD
jgi:hypothetical protein